MTDSSVQVLPDSTGKRIRTLEVNAILADGTVGTVEMQVLVQVDKEGNPIDPNLQLLLLTEIRDLLCEIRQHQAFNEGVL